MNICSSFLEMQLIGRLGGFDASYKRVFPIRLLCGLYKFAIIRRHSVLSPFHASSSKRLPGPSLLSLACRLLGNEVVQVNLPSYLIPYGFPSRRVSVSSSPFGATDLFPIPSLSLEKSGSTVEQL